MKLRNINPIGQVDLPLVRRMGDPADKVTEDDDGNTVPLEGEERHGHGCLEPVEVFDVDEEHARVLLEQATNYEPADDEAKALLEELAGDDGYDALKVPELRDMLNVRGLDPDGRKADLIARLRDYDRQGVNV